MLHRAELDGVRGIAIALVLLAHALFPTTVFPGGGVIGVQLFFVLSGFLITSILTTERRQSGRVDLRRFYERRARRLVPALAAFLVVYALWTIATDEPRGMQILVAATYISNWARVGGVDLTELNHTWSLAVEEQFYIVWPLALLAVVRFRRAALIVGVIVVGLLLWRIVLGGGDWGRIYYATDTNAASLLAGAALALVGVPTLRHGRWLGLVGMAVLLGLSLTMTVHTAFGRGALVLLGFPAATIASVALIVAAMNVGSAWLSARPLVFLGLISYGLYLWHTGINRVLDGYGWRVEARLLAIPVSIAIAWASWRFLESRFRRHTDAHPSRAFGVTAQPSHGPIAEHQPLSAS